MNVLVVSDTHIPFEHRGYLDFCLETKKKFKCTKIVHIGDLVDNHAISYHEHDPNGRSHIDEMELADKSLREWYKAFPKADLCIGNHDPLVARKARTHGLSNRVIKSFPEIWRLPRGWNYKWHYEIQGVKYEHGTGFSGKYPNANACYANRQSTVLGHCHSVAGVYWTASDRDIIFGMAVGSGLDRKKYAFWYSKEFKRKPILSCGVVLENGKIPQVIPMKL